MRIVFDTSTLEQRGNRGRSITGHVYFAFNGFSFPSSDWNDFVVVIVSWWLDALQTIRENQEATLRFMDGPYSLVLSVEKSDTALARCIEERDELVTIHQEFVELSDLCSEIHSLAQLIVFHCRENGMESSDVDLLESRVVGTA